MEIKSNEKIEQYKFKSCALFLSEFSYLIISAIIIPIGILIPLSHENTEFISFEGPSWNSSSDPLIFNHISDIHITRFKEIKELICDNIQRTHPSNNSPRKYKIII